MAKQWAIQHGTIGFRAWVGGVGQMPLPHQHFDVEVNCVFAGRVEYLLGGHRVAIGAGEWGVFWGAVPHRLIEHQPDTRMGWLTLPVGWLWRWRLPGEMMGQLLDGRLLVERESDPADPARLTSWANCFKRKDPRWRDVVELEVHARFRRLAMTDCTVRPSPRSRRARGRVGVRGGAVESVQAMAGFISEHFREPIDVAAVAGAAGLHPNYAMRRFRQRMGMTIIDYLTRQRIAEAQRRFLTSDDSVLDVALDCGFGSVSQFHAAFKRATGTTPGRFRRQSTDDAVAGPR